MKTAGQGSDRGGTTAPSELFNRATLEFTFTLLRKPYPALALSVQNAMTLAYPRHNYHSAVTASEIPLTASEVDRIALALSELSQVMVRRGGDARQAQLVLLRSLLLDWLMLARDRNGSVESLG